MDMKTLRIFISSVQKELELERAAVAGLISTDQAVRYAAKTNDIRLAFFENRPMPIRQSNKTCAFRQAMRRESLTGKIRLI